PMTTLLASIITRSPFCGIRSLYGRSTADISTSTDELYTEDFDHILGSRQGKIRQYLSRSGGISAKSAENHQSEKKI
ncbi:hypothetical protein BXA49_16410, partial [Enterococcus faecium]|uniref:hypothetical protein n=1 Tax=Enterococcus faecium TaxID=1352 RepID=UPI001A98BF81